MTKVNISFEHKLGKQFNKLLKIIEEVEKKSIANEYKGGLFYLNNARKFFSQIMLKDNWDKPIKPAEIRPKNPLFKEVIKAPEIDKKSDKTWQ